MIIIKGGVKIDPKTGNKEFIEQLKKAGVKVKLPFKATGFTSTKMPELADTTNIEFKTKTNKIQKSKSKKKKILMKLGL